MEGTRLMPEMVIPTDAVELEEMLNDTKRMAPIWASEAASREFTSKYAIAHTKKDPDLSNQLQEQLGKGLTDFFEANRFKPENKVPVNLSPTDLAAGGAVQNAMYNPQAIGAKIDGTYNNLGDFALDVFKANKVGAKVSNQAAWDKVVELSNAYSETDPGSGGFLVPEEMRSGIMSLALEKSVVRQRATVITMSSLTTRIPFVDETTHSGSVYGGMVFYWVGESASITPTEARFGSVKLEANKLVGGARIPNELWNDAPALRTWLQANAPRGLAFFEDKAFVSGSGVGQPYGFRNSPAKITAARAGANAITLADVVGMYARMLPSSLDSAVWLVNSTALPYLFSMATSGSGYPLGVVNINNKPVFTLLGRPLVVTEQLPANSAADGLMFVDLSYYLIGDRQAVSMDFSEHSRFMNDETELRIIERVDGRPWIQSALTPLNGDTLSPFVGLDIN
jgi:HK97 family phage major capsid protein